MNTIHTQDDHNLSEPFSKIFVDYAEAEWAFDLLRETTRRLRVSNPYDPRVAATLSTRSGRPFLHLNFGNWLVLGFRGPGLTPVRVDMALLAELVTWDERFSALSSTPKEGEPQVLGYELPIEMVRPLTSDLQRAFNATLDFIADKFAGWKRNPHWKQHNPELIEAFFDTEKRAQLFADGLDESVSYYERHLTAFDSVIAEEGEEYDEGDEESSEEIRDWEIGDGEMSEQELISEDLNAQEPQVTLNPPYPLAQLAEDTGFDEAMLSRWVRAIERKGQAILYGPPGTGKTFIAEKLAKHLTGGSDGLVDLVQFHPAYAYEDFIQGLRPTSRRDGGLDYRLVPGRFLEFCAKAQRRADRCVLIIDEINRANLSRVFGELMYLLEYREREIPLAGGSSLKIPDNARLIGTMNTADRSIALVDHALRRRFAFIALHPNFEALRRYHQQRQSDFPIENLITVLTRLNRQIDDLHYEVGITFFLREELTGEIEDIWQMEIEPYLEEYFFDQPNQVDAFRWAQIGQEIIK